MTIYDELKARGLIAQVTDEEEIISRAPHEAPWLWMDRSVTDFYAFTKDSLKLEGYQFHTLDQPIPVAV